MPTEEENTNGWNESKRLIRYQLDANDAAHGELKRQNADNFDVLHSGIQDIKADLSEMKLSDVKSRTIMAADICSLKTRVGRIEKAIATVTTGVALWALNQILGLV